MYCVLAYSHNVDPVVLVEPEKTARKAKPLTVTVTVDSLCNDGFGHQEICPCIKLSLIRGTTAVRMQRLVTNGVVLTLRLSLH